MKGHTMRDILSREPVRAALYPVIVLVVAFLAQRGVVDGDTQAFVFALSSLILGAFGVELARSKVSPVGGEQA